MTIWVDADACPVQIRDILFKAARRTGIELVLVANQHLKTPSVSNIRSVQVPQASTLLTMKSLRALQSAILL